MGMNFFIEPVFFIVIIVTVRIDKVIIQKIIFPPKTAEKNAVILRSEIFISVYVFENIFIYQSIFLFSDWFCTNEL